MRSSLHPGMISVGDLSDLPHSQDFERSVVEQICCLPVSEAEALLRRAVPETTDVVRMIDRIPNSTFREQIATRIFGQKGARDIGLVSTAGNPKTDFGEPSLGSGWDLSEK